MVNLIRNENMKIFARLRTWVMIALLVVLAASWSFVVWLDTGREAQQAWRTDLERNLDQLRQIEADAGRHADDAAGIAGQIALTEHRLEADIPPPSAAFWGPVLDQSVLVLLAALFAVIVAGDSLSAEFASGTVKLLLIRPVKRGKIVLAKYASVLLFGAFLMLVVLAASLAANLALYGTAGWDMPDLSVGPDGQIAERSMAGQLFLRFLLHGVKLVMFTAMAFMLSAVSRSSAMAIGCSIFLMLTGDAVSYFIHHYEWSKYWLFPNMNLGVYLNGGTPFKEGMTPGFSILVLVLYFTVFQLLAWLSFTRRDVKA